MVGQGRRGGGGASKKLSATPSKDADDGYIVFSNAKDDGKSKKTGANTSTGNNTSNTAQLSASNAAAKPDIRTLIGGASWTGKLPVNLLSEHCQKQRWEKPEYTMVWKSRTQTVAVLTDCRANPKRAFRQW